MLASTLPTELHQEGLAPPAALWTCASIQTKPVVEDQEGSGQWVKSLLPLKGHVARDHLWMFRESARDGKAYD